MQLLSIPAYCLMPSIWKVAKTGEWSLVMMSPVHPYEVLMIGAFGYDRHSTRSQYEGTLIRIWGSRQTNTMKL